MLIAVCLAIVLGLLIERIEFMPSGRAYCSTEYPTTKEHFSNRCGKT